MSILNVDKIQPIGSGSTVTVNATDTILTNAQAGVVTCTSVDSSGNISAAQGHYTDHIYIADKIVHTGDTNTAIRFPANDTFSVETAGTERLYIDSDGDVRIGNGAPNLAVGNGLEIDTGGAATIRLEDSGAGSGFEIQNTGGVIKQRLYNNQPWTIEYGGGEKFRIKSDGSIGVNEATPDFSGFGGNGGGIELDDVNTGFSAVKLSQSGTDFYLVAHSGAAYISTRTNKAIVIEKNSTEVAQFNDNGLKVPSGKGIDFSSTSDASGMSSEILDDYEEGEYIPTVTAATSGSWTTTSYRYLAYIKIGKLVHIQGYLNINSESSPNGSVRISLPFSVDTSLSQNAEYGNISVSMRSHGGSNIYNLNGSVSSNYIELIAVNGAGSHNWLDHSDIGSSWNIRIGGCYITS